MDPLDREARPGRLRQLAEVSGGEVFEPRATDQIPEVMRHIARDIRNMYTIGYVPEKSGGRGVRRIKVTASAPDGSALRVRTRQGYVAEEQ